MTKGDIIKYSVLGVVAIILILLVWRVFHKANKVDESYKEIIAAKDSLIMAKEQIIKAREELNKEKDKSIALHEKNDSLLRLKTVSIKDKYEKIPVVVRDYSDNQLRDSVLARYR